MERTVPKTPDNADNPAEFAEVPDLDEMRTLLRHIADSGGAIDVRAIDESVVSSLALSGLVACREVMDVCGDGSKLRLTQMGARHAVALSVESNSSL